MAISTTYESLETLINRGLSLNLRSINLNLANLFQRYSIALNKINGGELFGRTQTRKLKELDGTSTVYDKGRVTFKHNIDKLRFLIENRDIVEETVGISSSRIYTNRRNIAEVVKYLALLGNSYDLGEQLRTMQLYISKYEGNIGSLDSQQDWVDYIMTRDWIDELSAKSIDATWSVNEQDSVLADHRIEYLANMIQGMLKDHEIDYHKSIEEFDNSLYLDKTERKSGRRREPVDDDNKFIDAMRMLNSFGKLDYGFYEIFKPIGGTTEKYIKVKLSANGELDISGVVGLSDCEHVEWEYGSMEYLRSLNTGNQRYRFKLSMPFNDEDSVLWWKPDEKEQLEVENEDEEGEIKEPTGYRYYKPYETERFLRWFGTNYVPVIDPDSITKKTVCSAPYTSDDTESNGFYEDATNIASVGMNLTRTNITGQTSTSLLSMQPKATVEVIPILDNENPERSGQYLEFIVSGNQQTTNLAFHITGTMYNSIQEMNHFSYTWNTLILESYRNLGKRMLFLDITRTMNPTIEDKVWGRIHVGVPWIPDEWYQIMDCLKRLTRPNVIDLLRMRQIDMESIMTKVARQYKERYEFLDGITEKHPAISDEDQEQQQEDSYMAVEEYISDIDTISENTREEIMTDIYGRNYFNKDLHDYIMSFKSEDDYDNQAYLKIPLADETKKKQVKYPLMELYDIGIDNDQKERLSQELAKYEISFEDQPDVLSDRITTFNNLIVRLPTTTYHNKVASRHIFLDWKAYVDSTLEKLVNDEKLVYLPKTGMSTNGKTYNYTEYYTDTVFKVPLVDYSYLYDDSGELIVDEHGLPMHDRWDYWRETDFLNPLPKFSYETFDVLED